jgi:hypothetical protein
MIVPIVLCILLERNIPDPITFIVFDSCSFLIFIQLFLETVRIDKAVTSGVVGWVNVNHLDFAMIYALEKLEDLKVVAFNEKVFAGIEID